MVFRVERLDKVPVKLTERNVHGEETEKKRRETEKKRRKNGEKRQVRKLPKHVAVPEKSTDVVNMFI